jgi:CYTH domain-containing protein
MIDGSPGLGRYAVTEREQRWLLRCLPDGLTEPVEILDKYFSASSLRLRRAKSASTVIYKFGQKVRLDPSTPAVTQMTNMYLSQSEFELLGEIEGATLSKTRWHWCLGDIVLSVDQFGDRLQGLVLAEIELPVDGVSPTAPPLAVADVTVDDRFSGGHLASLTRLEAEDLLKQVTTMTAE